MPKPAPMVANLARLTLTINGQEYIVRPLGRADGTPGVARGFRLTRNDKRLGSVTYRIAETDRVLTCDYRYRKYPMQMACKHLAAARACGLI